MTSAATFQVKFEVACHNECISPLEKMLANSRGKMSSYSNMYTNLRVTSQTELNPLLVDFRRAIVAYAGILLRPTIANWCYACESSTSSSPSSTKPSHNGHQK